MALNLDGLKKAEEAEATPEKEPVKKATKTAKTADEKLAKIEAQEKALRKKKADIKKAQKKKELAQIEKNKILLAQFGMVVQKVLDRELDEKMLPKFEKFLKEQEGFTKAF